MARYENTTVIPTIHAIAYQRSTPGLRPFYVSRTTLVTIENGFAFAIASSQTGWCDGSTKADEMNVIVYFQMIRA